MTEIARVAELTRVDDKGLGVAGVLCVVAPAAHAPADAHENELTAAEPLAFRLVVPGTSKAFPHLPALSLTTKASCFWPDLFS